jgi:hypothetical protein
MRYTAERRNENSLPICVYLRTSADRSLPAPSSAQHASDYNPQNWAISLSELLRVIQFYNTGGYQACQEGEDRFCPGLV